MDPNLLGNRRLVARLDQGANQGLDRGRALQSNWNLWQTMRRLPNPNLYPHRCLSAKRALTLFRAMDTAVKMCLVRVMTLTFGRNLIRLKDMGIRLSLVGAVTLSRNIALVRARDTECHQVSLAQAVTRASKPARVRAQGLYPPVRIVRVVNQASKSARVRAQGLYPPVRLVRVVNQASNLARVQAEGLCPPVHFVRAVDTDPQVSIGLAVPWDSKLDFVCASNLSFKTVLGRVVNAGHQRELGRAATLDHRMDLGGARNLDLQEEISRVRILKPRCPQLVPRRPTAARDPHRLGRCLARMLHRMVSPGLTPLLELSLHSNRVDQMKTFFPLVQS
jgi:hypothetical protein